MFRMENVRNGVFVVVGLFGLIVKVMFLIVKLIVFYFIYRENKDIRDDILLIIGGGWGIGKVLVLEFVKYKLKYVCIMFCFLILYYCLYFFLLYKNVS